MGPMATLLEIKAALDKMGDPTATCAEIETLVKDYLRRGWSLFDPTAEGLRRELDQIWIAGKHVITVQTDETARLMRDANKVADIASRAIEALDAKEHHTEHVHEWIPAGTAVMAQAVNVYFGCRCGEARAVAVYPAQVN